MLKSIFKLQLRVFLSLSQTQLFQRFLDDLTQPQTSDTHVLLLQ